MAKKENEVSNTMVKTLVVTKDLNEKIEAKRKKEQPAASNHAFMVYLLEKSVQ